MSKSFVGLDIACDNLKLVELNGSAAKPRVVRSACLERPEEWLNPGFTNVNFMNMSQMVKQIAEVYQRAKINKTAVNLSIPAACVRVFFLRLESVSDNQADVKELLRWQLSKQFPTGDFQAVLSYQVIETNENGVEVMVVAASQAVVDEYLFLLNQAGKIPVRITADFLNAYNYFEPRLATLENYLFVYSDYDATSLLFFQGGRPVFQHRIDVGGRDYALPVARQKNLSVTEARQYLWQEKFFPEEDSADPRILENFSLIKDNNEKLFKKIYDSLRYFLNDHPQARIPQALLTGEGLAYPGVERFGSRFLEIDCQRLVTSPLAGIDATEMNKFLPALGVVLGDLKP